MAEELRLDANGLPVLDQFGEEGFVDCVFAVTDLSTDGDHYRFALSASFEGEEVGLQARLRRTIGPGFDADMQLIHAHVYREGLELASAGEKSDRLLAALAKLYGVGPAGPRMIDRERYTVIALEQEGCDLDLDAVRLKLFGRDGEDDPEEAYYESFFHVDLRNRRVCWNEKDPDYRVPLLQALGAG